LRSNLSAYKKSKIKVFIKLFSKSLQRCGDGVPAVFISLQPQGFSLRALAANKISQFIDFVLDLWFNEIYNQNLLTKGVNNEIF